MCRCTSWRSHLTTLSCSNVHSAIQDGFCPLSMLLFPSPRQNIQSLQFTVRSDIVTYEQADTQALYSSTSCAKNIGTFSATYIQR